MMRWFLIFSDCNVKFCIQLLVIFYVLKCKITTTLCILLLPQLFTFANSLNTLFRRGLLKFYWTAKNTMAFFFKCTHLRYPFRMHEISIGLGLEVLKDVNLTDCLCKNLKILKPKNLRFCFDHFHGSIYFILRHHEQYKRSWAPRRARRELSNLRQFF